MAVAVQDRGRLESEDRIELSSVVLLDIEGTTTLISFVKEKLFPFARKNLKEFLEVNWSEPEIQSVVEMLRKQCEADNSAGITDVPQILLPNDEKQNIIKSVTANAFWQMDADRKATALKALQGKVWKFGFENGTLVGHIFSDVRDAFLRWKENSKKIYIYSSGSVDAQKLLFRHSSYGDLSEFITGYFDTTSGSKLASQSYKNIASQIKEDTGNITFFTDIPAEAVAATEAGLNVVLMCRPGNAEIPQDELSTFRIAYNFDPYF